MPARSEDARINTVMRQICFIGSQRSRSRTTGGCNDAIGGYFRRRSRDIYIRGRSAIAGITLRNFRPRTGACVARRAGGKLSGAITFRDNNWAAGRYGLGIEHQHLAQRFFLRCVATGHRRSRRHGYRGLHRQPKLAKVSAGGCGSRRRNLRRGHRQRNGLQCVACGCLWRRRCNLWRGLRGNLKSIWLTRRDVGRWWNHNGAF